MVNKMSVRDRLIMLVTVLLIGVLGGAAGFFWMSNFYGTTNNSVYTERVTEKQVYLENSQTIQATQQVADSLVTIVDESKKTDLLTLAEPFKTGCFNVDTTDCGLNGVILTSDGIVAAVSTDADLDTRKLIAFDDNGQEFTVKLLSRNEANNLVFFQLYKPGDEQIAQGRVNNFSFKPVNFSDLKLIQVGQQVLIMKGNIFSNLANIRQTIVSSRLNPEQVSNWPLAFSVDDRANMIALAYINLTAGNAITDLDGNLIGLSEKTGGMIDIDTINNFLKKYKKSKQAKLSDLTFGLSVVKNSKKLAQQFTLSADYGYLVARGVNDKGELLADAVKKDSLAEKLGIKNGDLIVEIDGTSLLYENLWNILGGKMPGDELSVKVIRNKENLNLKMKI